ncbi:hypothetical protein QIS74_04451 [Colletotrichum tabaci]|uniref:Uncharacterized protein n=1 Tax=Colletotrichum tabaci TaxID=1209068 RepID=A0AAV9TIM7_9PEZI
MKEKHPGSLRDTTTRTYGLLPGPVKQYAPSFEKQQPSRREKQHPPLSPQQQSGESLRLSYLSAAS